METIVLSQKKLQLLNSYFLQNGIVSTESELLSFNIADKENILKRFTVEDRENIENKIYTIKQLNKYKKILPDNLVIPSHLVYVYNKIIGCTMPKIKSVNLNNILLDETISLTEKISYFKQIGRLLEQLENIRNNNLVQIYLNDIHENNFIIDSNNKVFVVDMDSCKIGKNKATASKYLNPFSLASQVEKYHPDISSLAYIEPNKNTEIYCYCIIILNFLLSHNMNNLKIEEFYDCLTYLELLGVDKKLVECFESIIINNRENKNPVDYLDSITENQFIKIRNKVL